MSRTSIASSIKALRKGFKNPNDKSVPSLNFMFCDIQDTWYARVFDSRNFVITCWNMAEASKILGIKQLVTEHKSELFGPTIPEVKNYLHPDTIIVNKTRFSMLDSEAISKYQPGSTFVLVGAESHICVLQTTLELIENGMNVIIVADGVTSFLEADRKVGMEVLRGLGAFVTTSQSLIFMMLENSDHPSFKDLLHIIKRMNGRKNLMLH